MWTLTSTCRPNGYRFTAPYPYEVAAGGAAAGELLRGVTGSRQILIISEMIRGGKGLTISFAFMSCAPTVPRTLHGNHGWLPARGTVLTRLPNRHRHRCRDRYRSRCRDPGTY